MRRFLAVLGFGILTGTFIGGCATHQGNASASAQQASVDLNNTVCPVSGEKVGDSKVTQVYDGKTYHMCCADCPKEFQKEPAKYVNAVNADPTKYGVVRGH